MPKDDGASVRCIENKVYPFREPPPPPRPKVIPQVVNVQNKAVLTIHIGDQVWMVNNLNVKVPGSYCYDDREENCERFNDAIIPRLSLTKNFNLTSSGSMVSISQVLNMPFRVQVFDLTGKLLQEIKGEGHNLQFKIQGKGVFRVRVISARASEMFTVKAY